jgi:hypothetical protein
MDRIAEALDKKRRISIITDKAVRQLSLADERSRKAGLLGADEAGLFKVGKKRKREGRP